MFQADFRNTYKFIKNRLLKILSSILPKLAGFEITTFILRIVSYMEDC